MIGDGVCEECGKPAVLWENCVHLAVDEMTRQYQKDAEDLQKKILRANFDENDPT